MASHNCDEDTPLHTAARFGVPELTALYLGHNAHVDVGNSRLETPLITAAYWAFCQREQIFSPDHHIVCRLLLDHGANPNIQEEDNKTALHKAAWNGDHILLEMLLSAGADARAMDINGCAPLQYLLKVTQVRPSSIPELCYQLLLNHGGARVYPPQFHKVNKRQPSSHMCSSEAGVLPGVCFPREHVVGMYRKEQEQHVGASQGCVEIILKNLDLESWWAKGEI